MKERRYALLLIICMLAGVAGCGKPQQGTSAGESEPQQSTLAGESEPQQGTSAEVSGTSAGGNGEAQGAGTAVYDSAEMELLKSGVNGFSYRLYERLDKEENIFFSPYSLCSALSLLNLGAGTQTREEMETLLGVTDIEAWNNAMRAYMETQWQDDTFVLTANSIWMREGKDWAEGIEADFLKPAEEYYKSELYEADFWGNPQDAVVRINNWANDNTKGMISEVLHDLPVDTAMILMNAVYFEGKWEKPFLEEDTYEQIFSGTTGENEIEMMHQYEEYYAYTEYDAGKGIVFQGIALPYKDSSLVMKIFLPAGRGEITSTFGSLSAEEKAELIDSLDSAPREKITRLALPKFTMEQEIAGLSDILQEMGMKTAFDMTGADFNKIAADLYVSQVLHKAKIEVDEQGTRAAAVTTIITNDGAAPIEENPIEFVADRPFVYVIQDTETGLILFMGQINHLE